MLHRRKSIPGACRRAVLARGGGGGGALRPPPPPPPSPRQNPPPGPPPPPLGVGEAAASGNLPHALSGFFIAVTERHPAATPMLTGRGDVELSRTSRGKDAACRGPQGAGFAVPGVLNFPSDLADDDRQHNRVSSSPSPGHQSSRDRY